MANNKLKDRVKNKSKQSANVIQLINVKSADLIDYPNNNEDCEHTLDLETSMKEKGFTTPIEITDFGMEEGKYMILAGHRRRKAGDKVGTFDTYPCLLNPMKSEEQIKNYVLMDNSHRDSAKNPMLLPDRYKRHYDYLESIGTDEKKIRANICTRMDISKAQGDRFFNLMMKIITTVHDMIHKNLVGISSVQMMAKHSVEEQNEITEILKDALSHEEVLTRPFAEKLIKGFREGKKTYQEIVKEEATEIMEGQNLLSDGVSVMGVNTEPSEAKDDSERNRNDEVRREYDPNNPLNEKDPYADERLLEEDYETIEAVSNADNKKAELSEEEKAMKIGKDLYKLVDKMANAFENVYTFEDNDEARDFIADMGILITCAVGEMHTISKKHGVTDNFKEVVNTIKSQIRDY